MRCVGDDRGSLLHSMTHRVPGIQFAVGHVDIIHAGLHAAEVFVGTGCIVVDLFISVLRTEDITAEIDVKCGRELGAKRLIP